MSKSSTSTDPDDRNQGGKNMPEIRKETRWEEVATAAGITAAQILAGRLQSEGIPARAWQEGAGQATGLVVGLLGTGHVVVPEEYAERAREILADVDEEFDENFEE
ncbi:MAG: DUF2007 domain-containing protein [Candidatus Promineifilaceae bacterium]|nr:DUF2007 domain-containing protein [Candidatus Promineifilaceae bacterium]